MQRLIDANAFKQNVCTYQQTGCGDCKHSLCCPEDVPTVLTIPDNPTNGDMIKAMFPNFENEINGSNIFITAEVHGEKFVTMFDLDWWNAPYKENTNDTNNN